MSGTLDSLGYNLTGIGTSVNCDFSSDDKLIPTEDVFTAVLDSNLADNGGPTLTHALLASTDNPALDGISEGIAGCGK